MSVVAERETGVLYVVDINYFPGYAGVPDVPAMMTRYGMEWYCIACHHLIIYRRLRLAT